MLYLAADHRGFQLKKELKKFLGEQGYQAEDIGAFEYDKDDDYVDFAIRASEKIAENPREHRGIFICGSGVGMDVAANKFKGLRAALCFDTHAAKQSREHGNTNVLVLAADDTAFEKAKEIVDAWLKTPFTGEERHGRRLAKIIEIENRNFK
ncbi:MAG: ribose 5-phosphate isomerase B [Parcubacteria group bacterium Gr01-1014_33]|nr:MAG: ribose 5-phosphate isomerase B [Parcubacteria group bacterium Gr01-1014_33]